ncbi:MAG TPA: ABC transporter permease [Candidatus Acidoferrum sp.]
MKHFATLTRMRIQLTLRNKMFLFFSVIMPFGFFFLYAGVFAKGEPRGVAYLLGPVIGLTVMGSFWGLSAALVTFREQGILRRFHVTPVTASDMLASSIVANYVLVLPTIIAQVLFSRFLFHTTNFGNPLSIFLLVTIGAIAFSSLGLVVASVTNTMQETQVINQLIWLPLIFLSGATIPLVTLSRSVQRVGLFLPATYLVNGLQRAIFAKVQPSGLLLEIFSLIFWAVLTFFLSAQLFRWEPESKIPGRAKLLVAATAIPFILLGIWELKTNQVLAQSQAMFRSLNAPAENRQAPPDKNP